MRKQIIIDNLRLGKFVHGGQCLAHADDDKPIFVWGGLPGELVNVRVTKKKSSYLEAIVQEVIEPSKDRVEPIEPKSYLSTSPWQIVDYAVENEAKQSIIEESFISEGLELDWENFAFPAEQYGYRNKLEIGFWGDDDGLHLAHFVRGTHGKQAVTENRLAREELNQAARDMRDELNRLNVWGGRLKTLMLRCSEPGEVVGALFVKEDMQELAELRKPALLKGLKIYLSNPKSPASVITKELYSHGDIKLSDSIMGKNITYDVNSFFQVNTDIFNTALTDIKSCIELHGEVDVVDYFSGVGTIGLAVDATKLIESEESNIEMARLNAEGNKAKVVHSKSEDALNHLKSDEVVIVDPPRAGLHEKFVEKLKEVKPKAVIYLSCNPSTQVRDVKMLSEVYDVKFSKGYNFFPRTPHIESLVHLVRK